VLSSASLGRVVRLGIRENVHQFSLLVLINAFVGAMVGIERVVLPILANEQFGVASRVAILSFIASFGIVKALANLFAGRLSERFGRKVILVAGWLIGVPVPLLIYFAPSWGWIVAANVFLGVNQGLCWSTTVIMKIDLAGPKRRGLAMGLNEASGYLAVSFAAFGSGYLAGVIGLRAAPALLGLCISVCGLTLSALFVRESLHHTRHESASRDLTAFEQRKSFIEVFLITSWKDRALFSVSQAGLINNLNDSIAWGLFPLYFASRGFSLHQITLLSGLYPAVWGIAQLGTGELSDRMGRKHLISAGMILQGLAILVLVFASGFLIYAAAAALLGLGTAMVYPTLLAAIGDVAHPSWRATAVGVYRLWRDAGYAVGAIVAGVLADMLGYQWAIGTVAALTLASGVVTAAVMYETHSTASALTRAGHKGAF
jgi:MFS family permease